MRLRGAAPALAVLVLVVVVGGFVLVGTVGLRGAGSEEEPRPDDPPTPSTSTAPSTVATVPSTVPTVPTVPVQGPIVHLSVPETDRSGFPPPPPVIGGLEPSAVLSIRVSGFDPFAVGHAQQCRAGGTTVCGNGIDVQFREDGTASFQYLVHRGPEGCGLGDESCSVVVRQVDGEGRAEIRTVFGEPLPAPGQVVVVPRVGLRPGQSVRVVARGQIPGAVLDVRQCAAPTTGGADRCAAGTTAVVGPDGVATADLRIADGPVGRDGVRCQRDQVCGIVVSSRSAFVRAPAVPLTFAAPAGAAYDPWRVALGLAAAAVLLAVAALLVRRTDWSPVGELAAPEIDEAEYADLDAMVAALPPEEEPVSS